MSNRKKRLVYGSSALVLFILEWLISRTDGFIRYTMGDLLVVMLIYVVLRVIFPNRPTPRWLAIGVFGFAFCVELSQYFDLIGLLGLRGERLAHLTMGSTFDAGDLAAYAVGCAAAFGADLLIQKKLFKGE